MNDLYILYKIFIVISIIGFVGMLILDIIDILFKKDNLTKNDKIFMIIATIVPIMNFVIFIVSVDFMIMYFINKK